MGRDRKEVECGSTRDAAQEANKNKDSESTKIIVNSVNREKERHQFFNSDNVYFCPYNRASIINILNKLFCVNMVAIKDIKQNEYSGQTMTKHVKFLFQKHIKA